MLKRAGILISSICLLLLTTSCSQDQHILERVGYVRTVGFDREDENRVRVTLSIPLILTEANQTRFTDEILTATAKSGKEARITLSRKTSRKLLSGQIRTIMYNTNIARQGLREFMDTLQRDPTISKRTELVIVDESVHDLLSRTYKGHLRTGQYIDRLLKKEFDMQTIPRILLHEFFRDYYDDGKDPIANMIRKSGEDLEYAGVALFHDDKYMGKLTPDEVFYFSIMYHDHGKGEFTVTSDKPEMKSVTLDGINSRKKVKIRKNEEGNYIADIYIKFNGSVLEYVGDMNLTSSADRSKLENLLNEHVVQQCEKVVKKLQKHRTDSIGIGQHVRNKMSYKAWMDSPWDEMYAKMEIRVHAKSKIRNFGNYYH
ncbi:Ger(x)C family spore germination protein [Paenibacillus sp. FSL R5-0407]|uniref:Ger(x)C family spore germination protein n=1 Tax=Paenibacillus sp. FSL R5-0407 TaxID=2975320 RepID=UPI0030FCE1FE